MEEAIELNVTMKQYPLTLNMLMPRLKKYCIKQFASICQFIVKYQYIGITLRNFLFKLKKLVIAFQNLNQNFFFIIKAICINSK
ncbi:unnamed protein product [Paramecium octaurelia]|uniref:Uncharacterized protein n=1 Tax=Paramecium octaurelia TaxID=43137 RepID=A0A8S1SN00_PAROT|nr:unnamed protein product [Paramecium octaurelia]